jgi:hypothetical protein
MFQIFKDKMNKISDSHTRLIQQRKFLDNILMSVEKEDIPVDEKSVKELKESINEYDISIVDHIHMNESFMEYAYNLCLKFFLTLKNNKDDFGKNDFFIR